jgi:hypothetical protein
MSRATVFFRFGGQGDGGRAHAKGQLVSTHHGTGSSQQPPGHGPADDVWGPEAPSSTSAHVRRANVQLLVGGRTVFAVYISPAIVAGAAVASLVLGAASWGHWPWP